MPMPIPSQVKVLRSAMELLSGELAALSTVEWETPGACGDWTVAETVAHLARGTDSYGLSLSRALEGVTDPLPGWPQFDERSAASVAVRQRAIDARRELGTGVLEYFDNACRDFLKLAEAFGPDDWRRPAYHPVMLIPSVSLMQWRLAEIAIHRWDIMRALGREPRLPERSHEPLLDWLPRWLRAGYNAGTPLAHPLHFRFQIAPPISRSLGLTLYGDSFTAGPVPDEDVTVTFQVDAESFILLTAGRLEWPPALAAGRVTFEGDAQQAAAFPAYFGAL